MEQQRYIKLVKSVSALIVPLASVVFILSFLSLIGYLLHIEFLYRPIENGPATHPLTALSFFLTAITLMGSASSNGTGLFHKVCGIAVLFIVIIKVLESSLVPGFLDGLTPFINVVLSERAQGASNSMGGNTVALILFVNAAILSYRWGYLLTALVFSFVGFVIPFIALCGYATSSPTLYGDMSFMTLTLGLFSSFVGIATVSQTIFIASKSYYTIKHLLSLSLTIICSIAPFIISLLLFTTVLSDDGNPIGLLILAISWFLIQMVGLFIYAIENVETRKMRY